MEKRRLVSIVRRFGQKRVLVIGDVALDSYLFGKIERVNPERPGHPLMRVIKVEYRPGGAGNVAANLASLGSKVSLIGPIGKDSYGEIFTKRCKNLGIKFIPVFEGNTLLKQRRIEIAHNDYLGRDDFGEGNLRKISQKNEDKIIKYLKKENPGIIILSDYDKRVFKGNLAKKIIAWARQKGVEVVVDPKPANILSFKGCSVVSPNLKEAGEIVNSKENAEEVSKKLIEVVKSKYVVVTCGADGITNYDGNFYHIPTEAREIADVSGAGDTVIAALGLSLISGASLKEATVIANHSAGIVVEKAGTACVTRKELIDRILSG